MTDKSTPNPITKAVVKKILLEAMDADEFLLTGAQDGDKKLSAFVKKVQTFLDETFATADELADEGESLLTENFLHNQAASERKRLVLTLIGYLRTTRNTIGNVMKLRTLIGESKKNK